MGYTFIECGSEKERVHYGVLEMFLKLLVAVNTLSNEDPARSIIEQWLSDISPDVGYVELSSVVLSDPSARESLRNHTSSFINRLTDEDDLLLEEKFGTKLDESSSKARILSEAKRLNNFLERIS